MVGSQEAMFSSCQPVEDHQAAAAAQLPVARSRRHEQNCEMMDKIADVLNKVSTTYTSDRFATPLRIQRDLLYGPQIHPSELEKTLYTSNSS